MAIATIALVGIFVALYLSLYKLGVIGQLACSTGSCETVQLSRWADLLGIPVAAWGVGYYALLFALALVGLQERYYDSRAVPLALLLLTGWGVVFTAWLTWLELYVIHAICVYCVVSAVLVSVLFVLCWLEWRASRAIDGDAIGRDEIGA